MHTTPSSWYEAYEVCSAEQAHLVILNSVEEAQRCFDTFHEYYAARLEESDFDKDSMWLGFHDFVLRGKFKTVDGVF